jgi:hypothetical protein
MTMKLTRALLAAALFVAPVLASSPAIAQITERDVTRGRVALDPARGYVFMRSPGRLAGTFLRVPDATALEEYRAARSARFAEEVEAYQRRYASWERRNEERVGRRLDPPLEPTEESFTFPAFEALNAQSFGPTYAFAETEGDPLQFSYLTVLPPGRYIWYGPVFIDPSQGAVGACYCMGSVEFDVPAGRITDLGNFLMAAPQAEGNVTAPLPPIRHMSGLNGFRIEIPEHSSEVRYGLPASLASWPSQQAEFHASGKTNNIYGVRITRLAPIPGVLGYRRDVVVDERTGEELVAVAAN